MTKISGKAALFLIISICSSQTPAFSQTPKRDLLPYAFGSTIDVSAGPAFGINCLYPGSTKHLFSTGADITLRYSYYFGKHFGAYASFFAMNTSPDTEKYLGSLGDNFIYTTEDCINEENTGFLAGCAYRYDFGRWSLRPRAGIGFSSYKAGYWSFYKFSKDKPDKDPEHIMMRMQDKGANISKNFFAIEAGLQMTFTIGSHFFLSAEVGTRIIPGSCQFREDIFNTRTMTPQTWVDALLETYKDTHLNTERISERNLKAPVGDLISIRFGIGWNIGFNRNVKR